MSWSAVEAWLKTLGLHGYCQAFIDNGYDELDVCRQMGAPDLDELDVCRQMGTEDLDAIGVTSPTDRECLLAAVGQLQRSAGTSTSWTSCVATPVYFTLENPDTTTEDVTAGLKTLISERLSDDDITISAEPYMTQVNDCTLYTVHCSVLFLSRPRSEGWPHHGRTFSIYLYSL